MSKGKFQFKFAWILGAFPFLLIVMIGIAILLHRQETKPTVSKLKWRQAISVQNLQNDIAKWRLIKDLQSLDGWVISSLGELNSGYQMTEKETQSGKIIWADLSSNPRIAYKAIYCNKLKSLEVLSCLQLAKSLADTKAKTSIRWVFYEEENQKYLEKTRNHEKFLPLAIPSEFAKWEKDSEVFNAWVDWLKSREAFLRKQITK